MPATSSEGRRAAQASAAPMDNDQIERDANLKKVQARDLVEFGMIPVSEDFEFIVLDFFVIDLCHFCVSGIRWQISRFSSISFA